MGYNIHDSAQNAASDLKKVKVDLESKKDVVTIDNKPLNFNVVVKRINELISETSQELNKTNNIN